MLLTFTDGMTVNAPQMEVAQWACSLTASPLLCLLLTGLWEVSRWAAEPRGIHGLPTRLQHGTRSRVSARPSLSSCLFLASAALPAAPTQWAFVLQHQLPRPWSSGSVNVPQGAIRVTGLIAYSSASGDMMVSLMRHGKQSFAEQMCINPTLPLLFYARGTYFHPTWWKCL